MERTTPAGEPCTAYICTWDPAKGFSWQKNDERTATQNFYFINTWHDYLQKAPIGFTEAAGNFQQVNASGQGKGGDPVHNESLDGANTQARACPTCSHIDNANFATPPDGQPPTMQMYLWHAPGASSEQDPFIPTMGSDEADIVYHEYTHGLSHRLVTDANNNPALDSVQGGSMGEAWSDWYALDYLVNQGSIKDTRKPGDINLGVYVGAGTGIRSEATDCPVGSTAAACPGTKGTSTGGYTYGDFGRIYDATGDVHAAGEIWAQTLWDLRGAARPAAGRVAGDPRHGAVADLPVLPGHAQRHPAGRPGDPPRQATPRRSGRSSPRAGWASSPAPSAVTTCTRWRTSPPRRRPARPRGTLTGTVTDQGTGTPVKGATVAFGGHNSGFPGDYAATTGAEGRYTITRHPARHLPRRRRRRRRVRPAADDACRSVGARTSKNWAVRRDWAAASGGGLGDRLQRARLHRLRLRPGRPASTSPSAPAGAARPAARSTSW